MTGHKERCIKYAVPYDPSITSRVVYEQSGWTCHLCGKKVSKRLKYPHPKSASLDHLIPLSWRHDSPGHVWGNVALAHLRCNVKKGARFAGSTKPAPRRPSRITPLWKYRLAVFTSTIVAFNIGATAPVLTVGIILCILSVLPKRRRRARWRL